MSGKNMLEIVHTNKPWLNTLEMEIGEPDDNSFATQSTCDTTVDEVKTVDGAGIDCIYLKRPIQSIGSFRRQSIDQRRKWSVSDLESRNRKHSDFTSKSQPEQEHSLDIDELQRKLLEDSRRRIEIEREIYRTSLAHYSTSMINRKRRKRELEALARRYISQRKNV
jgi:hypothetical protein